MNNVYALRRIDAISLRQMAVAAHPANRRHQARWIRAIRFLRSRDLWILDRRATRRGQGEAA